MKKSNFQHFILTRFNIQVKTWEKNKNNTLVINDKWLEHRFNLFEKICFPSITNQTNKDFIWIVVFDIETPKKYLDKISEYRNKFNDFIPIFINKTNDFKKEFKKEILKNLNNDTEYILTTRIDNDDAFHKDAVKLIQSCFIAENNIIINPENGICLQIEPDILISKIHSPFNPFISLIESIDNIKTIFFENHNSWDLNQYNVINIKDKKIWLQTIHSKNLLNEFRFNYFLLNNYVLKDFNIDKMFVESKLIHTIKSIKENIKYFDILLKNKFFYN